MSRIWQGLGILAVLILGWSPLAWGQGVTTEPKPPSGEWGRNPFYSPFRKTPFIRSRLSDRALRLTGTLHSRKEALAIISNLIVREGDEVKGAKVVKIERKKVILEDERGKYILPLGGGLMEIPSLPPAEANLVEEGGSGEE